VDSRIISLSDCHEFFPIEIEMEMCRIVQYATAIVEMKNKDSWMNLDL